MTARRAIVIGARGQDGTLLSGHLETLGYAVTRIGREVDILDESQMVTLIRTLQPDEVYYLAAFHHSAEDAPLDANALLDQSMAVNFRAFVNVLEAAAGHCPMARIFYASSSLVFGDASEAPQNEDTPVAPAGAYGISKARGMEACRLYRRERGMFAAAGILYNHESPLRDPRFVSRKIARHAARAAKGTTEKLRLGSLDAQVDWSAASDTVRAMHLMQQLDKPQDFVVASGVLHTIRDFAAIAFGAVGLDYREHVEVDDTIVRRKGGAVPLHGDPSRLIAATGYTPQVSFREMVETMVAAEVKAS